VNYISSTSTLVVRGTQENMDLIEVLLADLVDQLPAVLRMRVELYEVPKADALKVITETDSKPSADDAMAIVRGLVESGDARLLASPSLITRSGQRAKIEAGESIEYVASYKPVDGKDAPVVKKVLAGTSVEVEPTVGADGQTIDVNIAISMARGKPTFHKRKIVAPASGLEREVESVSIAAQTLSLAFTTITGQTQLVGNLQSDVVDNPNAVLAFVTATITRATR
jgi:type II secretory pathway component GspD/PulD (secretin)